MNLGDPLGSEASTVHNELERPVEGVNKCEPWNRVVADLGPCDHTVQLGQARTLASVCRFVGVAREWRGFPSRASVHRLEPHRLIGTLLVSQSRALLSDGVRGPAEERMQTRHCVPHNSG